MSVVQTHAGGQETKDFEELKKEAAQYIRYEKDKANKIAWLTFDRPDMLNATTAGMRQLYADLVHKANIDDDVKVLVIRGAGNNFGGGGDLPEQADMLSESDEDISLLHEFGINDPDVKYPPKSSYRFLHGLTDHYAKARAGRRRGSGPVPGSPRDSPSASGARSAASREVRPA